MSGETNLDLTKQQMQTVEAALDAYENSCGLPEFTNPIEDKESAEYFNMPRNVIEKLTSEDCSQIAYRLAQLSFHLQRCLNREEARMAWAKANLDKIIAKESGQFDKFTKHDMKVELIKQTNSYAESLGKILNYAEQRVKRLAFLAASVKNLSDVMLANHRSKSYGSSRSS